ncbi:hypothetical protein Tco_0231399 [Tanacetum coccineum]
MVGILLSSSSWGSQLSILRGLSIRIDFFDNADGIVSYRIAGLFDAIQLMVTDQARKLKHLKAQSRSLKKESQNLVIAPPLSLDEECLHDSYNLICCMREEVLKGKVGCKRRMLKDVGGQKGSVVEEEEVLKNALDKELVRQRDKRVVPMTYERTKGRSATPTTPTPTPTIFGDDETITQVLINMSQAKAVSREKNFDDIKARMEADRLLALRLQEEERESSSLWKREQNSFMIQLQLKEDLKNKTFEEIQALYEKVKRFDESFTAVGSTEDERKIKEMNEGAKDLEQKRLKKKVAKETPKKEDTAKVPAKVDVTEQGTKKRKGGHMKMIARKRKRPQPDVDSNDEHRECLKIVTFEGTIDSDIMEKKSFIARMNKVSSPDGDYLVIYRANGNILGIQISFGVMKQYLEVTMEGIELILWGDLKIMMESSKEENDQSDFWNNQQNWEIVTWRLYEACGVYILELEDGTVIHMLVERRVLNSPCFMVKSWLVQDQTVLGKDYSNLLIADSLLKTIWFINAPCYGNEALTSPKANGFG